MTVLQVSSRPSNPETTRCPGRTKQGKNGCQALGTITAPARGGAGGPQQFPGEADAGTRLLEGRDSRPGR